ncbi:MAG: UDP-N-acetylmuramoyl-L-alanine--D-glutamate ligase [Chloroflexi bacterium]|nr:UDP-N-acetylmuramoyl-L-alanine--D-glutamate ligase [Chloroflexota bacterium]
MNPLDLKEKRVSIMGLGRTGIALARTLHNMGAKLFLSESENSNNLNSTLELLKDIPAEIESGGHTDLIYKDKDLIVISPGIPSNIPVLEEARKHGVEVISEVELAYRLCPAPIIAITGTKGKSTTATILNRLLEAHGIPSLLAGNIGIPVVSELSRAKENGWVVLEVSSFQLETVKEFHPKVAAFLNFYPDHLDRHQTMQEYLDMKMRIFSCQDENDLAVLNADDPAVIESTAGIKAKKLLFGVDYRPGLSAYIDDDELVVALNGHKIRLSPKNKNLMGAHIRKNALAALLIAHIAGADLGNALEVLENFKPLPHRLQRIAEVDGILYVDDSKSTTPHSSKAAVMSFARPVILIAGGRDKGLDFTPLTCELSKKVKALVVMGEASGKISQAAKEQGFDDIITAGNMEDALLKAREAANEGDVILLSPGCTSFDMFKNAEERGNSFTSLVEKMTGGGEI